MWASKLEEQGTVRCHFTPLLLRPPAHCFRGDGCVAMQQLVDLWHRQDRVHAALRCPENLVLQASRFHFDVHTGVAEKLCYEIIPDHELLFPVFEEGMSIVHMRFRLCSFALHLGSAPDRGHYKVIMLASDNSLHVFDDNVVATSCCDREFRDSCRNSYLFFYHRHVRA